MVFFPSLTKFQTRFQNDYNEQYALYLITRSLIKYSCSKYVHLRKVRFGFFFSFFVDVSTNILIHLSFQPFLRFLLLIGITKNYATVNKIDAMSVYLTYLDDLVGTFVRTKSRVHRLEFFLHFEFKYFDLTF